MNNTKEVDWDKAPEGATRYNEERSRPWLRDVPASFYYDGECFEDHEQMQRFQGKGG